MNVLASYILTACLGGEQVSNMKSTQISSPGFTNYFISAGGLSFCMWQSNGQDFFSDLVGYRGFLLSVACMKSRTGHQYDCPCPVSVLKRDIQDEAEGLFFWTRRTFNDVYKEHPPLWNSVILHHIPLSQSTTNHHSSFLHPYMHKIQRHSYTAKYLHTRNAEVRPSHMMSLTSWLTWLQRKMCKYQITRYPLCNHEDEDLYESCGDRACGVARYEWVNEICGQCFYNLPRSLTSMNRKDIVIKGRKCSSSLSFLFMACPLLNDY